MGKYVLGNCRNIETVKISNNITTLNGLLGGTNSIGGVYEDNVPINIKKLYLPKINSINIHDFSLYFSTHPDIYYNGSIKDWRSIEYSEGDGMEVYNAMSLFNSNLHFNSTVEDYRNGKDAGKGDDWNAPYDLITVSLNDSITVTYNSSIAFYNKKAEPENFGSITILYNGQEYTATKIKVNKTNDKYQITNISPANKQLKKIVKKLTKGNKGLNFTMGKYFVTYTSDAKISINPKKSTLTGASVKINGKYYKMKKIIKDYFGCGFTFDHNWVMFTDKNVFGTNCCSDSLEQKLKY